MKNITKMHIGVDISKGHLDVCINSTKKKIRLSNNSEGVKKFQQLFPAVNVEQLVCEASGGYENTIVQTCTQDGYKVWVVEPKRIKGFASAVGKKAKSDKIDSEMIALFSATIERNYEQAAITPEQLHLREMVKRKNDLKKMAAMEKTRLQNPRYFHTKKQIECHISFLEEQIEQLNKEIIRMIKESGEWQERKRVMESMPGIGQETSAALISDMPELGAITGKQAASLIGVAPFTKQSGNYVGYAKIRDGRFEPRKALYMAALTASRHNPIYKIFYEKLIQKGKPAKVAIVAVMRRMIVAINAMIRDTTEWNPELLVKKY